MSNSYFQFKQFTVWHNKCAMKVGTDGVLLGAWPRVDAAKRILDVGSGTGLVALMIAQRSHAFIVALEVDTAAVQQAAENIEKSPWQDRIRVVQGNFKEYTSTTLFDVIVSNPPYFANSLQCADKQRNIARHNDDLSYESLLKGVTSLLSKDGEFTIIIPTEVADKVKDIAANHYLYPSRQLNVTTSPGLPPKRTLITFTFKKQELYVEELLIELSRHQYSEKYIELTKEYYLKM